MNSLVRLNLVTTSFVGVGALLSWAYAIYQSVIFWSSPPAVVALAISLSALFAVGWVLTNMASRIADEQTRCRRCGHILRGLTEPMCPECGERI